MNRPDPRAEETQLEFYPLRLPRWPALLRLRRRDPLVRPADRIEAVVAALATVMVVIATPLAAAVGTEVHANHRLAYTEQSQDRHTVPATVVETPGTADNPRLNTTTVTVSWSLDGVQHTGTTRAPADVEPGDTVDIWVDD
ncbi:Rv1733c family protein, partial [Mycolicibacterium sp.]